MNDNHDSFQEEDIETGEYYVAAKGWYSDIFHTPIAERSYYIIIITLAIINFFYALDSFIGIFPVRPSAPFITYSENSLDEWPRIKRLSVSSSEDKNIAVMRFLLENYVINRESYDLKNYELRYRNIWSQSTDAVFEAYKAQMAASNPASPYHQYTNEAKRVVDVMSVTYNTGKEASHARIIFKTTIISLVNNKEISHTKWVADITYKYDNFVVDQRLNTDNKLAKFFGLTTDAHKDSGEKDSVVPMKFIVSDYQMKELLE